MRFPRLPSRVLAHCKRLPVAIITVALPVVLVASCVNTHPDTLTAPPAYRPDIGLAELQNATYRGITSQSITLVNGEWQGQPFVAGGAVRPRAGLVADFRLHGDMNNDGRDETVALVWFSTGGSGTVDYLAIMSRTEDGTTTNLATAALGDRVRIRSAAIDHGELIVELVQAGENDAACCPGQKVQRRFVLTNGSLTEISSIDQGRLSTDDLADVEWQLLTSSLADDIPDSVAINLRIMDNRLSGHSGCNRYSGSISEHETPGALSLVGPMAVTMMACPESAANTEKRYLNALQAVDRYSFMAGHLVLSWQTATQHGRLIFTAE